jgi:hypothetical protein
MQLNTPTSAARGSICIVPDKCFQGVDHPRTQPGDDSGHEFCCRPAELSIGNPHDHTEDGVEDDQNLRPGNVFLIDPFGCGVRSLSIHFQAWPVEAGEGAVDVYSDPGAHFLEKYLCADEFGHPKDGQSSEEFRGIDLGDFPGRWSPLSCCT